MRTISQLVKLLGTLFKEGLCDNETFEGIAKRLGEPAWRVVLATRIWEEDNVRREPGPYLEPTAFVEPAASDRFRLLVGICCVPYLTVHWEMPKDGIHRRFRCLRCGESSLWDETSLRDPVLTGRAGYPGAEPRGSAPKDLSQGGKTPAGNVTESLSCFPIVTPHEPMAKAPRADTTQEGW